MADFQSGDKILSLSKKPDPMLRQFSVQRFAFSYIYHQKFTDYKESFIYYH